VGVSSLIKITRIKSQMSLKFTFQKNIELLDKKRKKKVAKTKV